MYASIARFILCFSAASFEAIIPSLAGAQNKIDNYEFSAGVEIECSIIDQKFEGIKIRYQLESEQNNEALFFKSWEDSLRFPIREKVKSTAVSLSGTQRIYVSDSAKFRTGDIELLPGGVRRVVASIAKNPSSPGNAVLQVDSSKIATKQSTSAYNMSLTTEFPLSILVNTNGESPGLLRDTGHIHEKMSSTLLGSGIILECKSSRIGFYRELGNKEIRGLRIIKSKTTKQAAAKKNEES